MGEGASGTEQGNLIGRDRVPEHTPTLPQAVKLKTTGQTNRRGFFRMLLGAVLTGVGLGALTPAHEPTSTEDPNNPVITSPDHLPKNAATLTHVSQPPTPTETPAPTATREIVIPPRSLDERAIQEINRQEILRNKKET